MRKDFDLWITNLITGEVKVVHDFSDFGYYNDDELTSRILFMHIKPYFDNRQPIKLEIVNK